MKIFIKNNANRIKNKSNYQWLITLQFTPLLVALLDIFFHALLITSHCHKSPNHEHLQACCFAIILSEGCV